jgi:energy-coupling factor transport system permease protein
MKRSNVFQFRTGHSVFHRLDPLSKLAWLVAISLLAFGAYVGWVQVVIALIVIATALILARLSASEIVRGTSLFIIACAGFFVVQSVTLGGTTVAFYVLSRPVHVESIDYALASALRIYAVILSSLVFVRSTDPRDLAIALVTQLRIPYRIAYAFFIALRIVPVIEEEIKIMRAAQAVRGVARKRGLTARISETKRYAMPLLVGSLRRASLMVMSMEGRAFGAYPQRTFVDAPHMGPLGVAISVLSIAAVAGWYAALALGYVHALYVFAPA